LTFLHLKHTFLDGAEINHLLIIDFYCIVGQIGDKLLKTERKKTLFFSAMSDNELDELLSQLKDACKK